MPYCCAAKSIANARGATHRAFRCVSMGLFVMDNLCVYVVEDGSRDFDSQCAN